MIQISLTIVMINTEMDKKQVLFYPEVMAKTIMRKSVGSTIYSRNSRLKFIMLLRNQLMNILGDFRNFAVFFFHTVFL